MRSVAGLAIILTLIAPGALAAADSVEYWHGHAGNAVNGVTLDVTITTTADVQRGVMTLHELAGADIPLRRVSRMMIIPSDLSSGGWPRRIPQYAPLVTDWIVHETVKRAASHAAKPER